LVVLLILAGCRSRFVAATITNGTDRPLQMIEVDYPGGSFGVSTLAPHAVYSYRFKAIGSGSLSISYADAAGSTRNATGPRMAESQGGSLTITIGDKGDVRWSPQLNKP
jgi:hypothetical protein